MLLSISDFENLELKVKKWDIIFLYWDLWSWKTTLIKFIINNILKIKDKVKSPTYIHYKKFKKNIYHFDLYRLENYEEFINIGWEEILDDKNNICFIEWPELIEKYYKPNIIIKLKQIKNNDDVRDIEIINLKI